MKIYAIRHTSVNVQPGICYGQTDVGVATSFDDEQRRVTQELEQVSFDTVWSSPLLRCRTLAESVFPMTRYFSIRV